ncbi:MAG: hypothetical protein RLY31_3096 [Bacteroidota bacterium]|jgi:nucleoside-diphosphate-sugar epimerase
MSKDTILVTGANGQIGSVLTKSLQEHYGIRQVLATDIRPPAEATEGLFLILDVTDRQALNDLVSRHRVTQIYHLAAILSAKGESAPLHTWDINMQGLFHILEAAREHRVAKVFHPSSIAVFGSEAPRMQTPQNASLQPSTVYGISKVAGEMWAQYYFRRYALDIRSLRYPGVIGHQSAPGGGTTDYAVEMYHYALQGRPYPCFLRPDTALPMIYMDDAIRATRLLMEAPADLIRIRTSYNLSALTFTPAELADSIRRHIPSFQVDYQPDFRQQIADSWPASIDDRAARSDWDWHPAFDLSGMTADMLLHLQERYLAPA